MPSRVASVEILCRGSYCRLFAQHGDQGALSKFEVRKTALVFYLHFRPVAFWSLPTRQQIGLQEMAALATVRCCALDPAFWRARFVTIADVRVVRSAFPRGWAVSRLLGAAL